MRVQPGPDNAANFQRRLHEAFCCGFSGYLILHTLCMSCTVCDCVCIRCDKANFQRRYLILHTLCMSRTVCDCVCIRCDKANFQRRYLILHTLCMSCTVCDCVCIRCDKANFQRRYLILHTLCMSCTVCDCVCIRCDKRLCMLIAYWRADFSVKVCVQLPEEILP